MTFEELKNLHGLFLIDKPAGGTSFGVLEEMKRMLMRETGIPMKHLPKMGHGGTLDPFATGLLIVCFNDGVKLSRYFLDSKKVYRAVIEFGSTTSSGDLTNEVIGRTDRVPESLEEIQAAAAEFCKRPYDQIPPMHSAKKIGGETLYKLARQGKEVERAPKRCTISRFEVTRYDPTSRQAEFICEVSAGTYVRTLAQDLALQMGSLGFLTELRRLSSGKFSIEQAVPPSELLSLKGFVPLNEALPHFSRVAVAEDEARALREGRQECLTDILERQEVPESVHHVALFSGPDLLGVAAREEGTWGIERILSRA